MAFAEVSNILWRERQLLELLQFKLEEEQLVLASSKARWLTHATREVEMVLEELRKAELTRAMEVTALASQLGLGTNPSLTDISSAAPSPWDGIFEEHRRAFLSATQEIQSLANVNRELLAAGLEATQHALEWATGAADDLPDLDVYTPQGTAAVSRQEPKARLLNEAL
jgi:flagellar biosynthesis/type III secretory pathway chaperone